MSLFLTLGVLVTFMISFCVKKANSLSKDNPISKNQENKTLPSIENTDEKNPIEHNLDEVKSLLPYFSNTIVKKDPGGLGFLDDVGGSIDGLMSCTESLGFESSDERRLDNDDDDLGKQRERFSHPSSQAYRSSSSLSGKISKIISARYEVKKYPPPLSSLNCNGKPNFFLRPLRRDGRLELAEVKIERPEILRASREDGRLKLDMVEELDQDEDEEEDELEEIVETCVEEKEEEKWLFPMMIGGRCHEAVTRHHHHHMHRVGSPVW